jgi:hypothetical protein
LPTLGQLVSFDSSSKMDRTSSVFTSLSFSILFFWYRMDKSKLNSYQKIITLISLATNLSTCSRRYEGTQITRLFPILLILPRNSMVGSGCFAAAAAATSFFAWTRILFTFFSSNSFSIVSWSEPLAKRREWIFTCLKQN